MAFKVRKWLRLRNFVFFVLGLLAMFGVWFFFP